MSPAFEMPTVFEALLSDVRSANTITWSQASNLSLEDLKCIAVVECAKLDLRPHIDHALSVRLQVFIFRMAELAVRAGSLAVLEASAIALALEGVTDREAYSLLALVRHSALKLSAAPEDVFASVMTYAGADARRRMAGFLSTAEEKRTIEAMGFKEVQKREGFGYQFDPVQQAR